MQRWCNACATSMRELLPPMIRLATALCLIVLPVAAPAQTGEGALGPMDAPRRESLPEPMSRAQIAQTIAGHGYLEMRDLAPQRDGSWTCAALVGPGRRVALTAAKNGATTQRDLPRDGAH